MKVYTASFDRIMSQTEFTQSPFSTGIFNATINGQSVRAFQGVDRFTVVEFNDIKNFTVSAKEFLLSIESLPFLEGPKCSGAGAIRLIDVKPDIIEKIDAIPLPSENLYGYASERTFAIIEVFHYHATALIMSTTESIIERCTLIRPLNRLSSYLGFS